MSSLSKAYEKKVLEALVGKTALTTPTAWIALCTAAPTSSSTGSTIVEATYTGYTRVKTEATTWKAAVEGTPSEIVNNSLIEFPACTGSTSKVGWVAICDAETTGNVIAWGALTEEKEISTTNTPASFAAEALKLTLS